MKRLPTRLKAIIRGTTDLATATQALKWSITNATWKLNGYRLEPGEDFGGWCKGLEYWFLCNEDASHTVIVDLTGPFSEQTEWDYPEIRNVNALIRAKTRAVRVKSENILKNRNTSGFNNKKLEEIQNG